MRQTQPPLAAESQTLPYLKRGSQARAVTGFHIWLICSASSARRSVSARANNRRYVIGGGCEWSRCVMACGIGWMAMACRRVSPVG